MVRKSIDLPLYIHTHTDKLKVSDNILKFNSSLSL
jgi:hypothetical protein